MIFCCQPGPWRVARRGERAAYVGADETVVYDPWASSGSPAPLGLLAKEMWPPLVKEETCPASCLCSLCLSMVQGHHFGFGLEGLAPTAYGSPGLLWASTLLACSPGLLWASQNLHHPPTHLMVRWATQGTAKGLGHRTHRVFLERVPPLDL